MDTHLNKTGEFNNILITGGCGFIGINLAKDLSERGYKVRIIDNLLTGDKQTLLSAAGYVQLQDIVTGDVRDKDLVLDIVENVDAIIHLAAFTSVVESLKKPELCWDINVTGTLNLLEACRISGNKRFIFASSNAVLGKQAPPADENKVPTPLSPYGATKLACEALCAAYSNSYGINTTCLRFANCYGPYSKNKPAVIPLFINRLQNKKPLIIYGDGNQTRDFVHVHDICQAIRLCLSTGSSLSGEIFQIASGVETSINELISILRNICGDNIEVKHKPERKGEIIRNYSDITKARRILHYEPAISLQEGLRQLMTEPDKL